MAVRLTKNTVAEALARRASLEGCTATLAQQQGRRPSRLVRSAHSRLKVTETEGAEMMQTNTLEGRR
jgi:hypothetical protein